MAIGIIDGCEFYSSIIQDAVDFEKDRAEYPNSTYKIRKLHDDYDVSMYYNFQITETHWARMRRYQYQIELL